jgi:cytochrome c-type biogenesis protein
MRVPNNSRLMLVLVFLLLSIEVAYSYEQVIVEFLYSNPQDDPRYCGTCSPWIALYNKFVAKNDTTNSIRSDYESEAVFEWIDITSDEGEEKQQLYQVSPNSIVINGEIKIEGDFNETYIREIIDSILEEISPPPQPSESLMPILALAFSFGFFDAFSPCIIALLSFILSYTVGKTTRFKESILQVMLFGVGFVFAAVLIGLTVGLTFLSFQPFQVVLTWIVCFFAIFFGLNQLGLLKIPFETKPLVKKLARKYVLTYGGLVLLGSLFYFLDPCIAPIFIAMLPILSLEALPLILLIFSLGVILPFFLIGILAGSISKLARGTYKHKSKIRAISGLILIAYAIYLIFFFLL